MAIKTNVFFRITNLGIFVVLTTILSSNVAGIAYGQSELLPFEIGDIPNASKNTNTSNPVGNLTSTNDEQNDQIIDCEMPPCPPGQACIQSCPEIIIQ